MNNKFGEFKFIEQAKSEDNFHKVFGSIFIIS